MKNPNKENIKRGDRVRLLDFRDEDWKRHDSEFHGNFFWIKSFDDLIGCELTVNDVQKDGIFCRNVSGGFNFYWVQKVPEANDVLPEEMFEI